MSDVRLNTCGACAGVDPETPARLDNPPGLATIAYRVGVHGTFKESMLAALAGQALTTRDDTDISIALCDAVASTLDVLSFYQERIAHENFLRTATERRSIQALARLIGYELAPGVAASTWLAFGLQEVPGSPALSAAPVTLPVGTKVQSVPGQDETAQTFETVEAVQARVEWNAIPVQTTVPWQPLFGDRSLWLAGIGLGVLAGDAILIVGSERGEDDEGSERWDIRVLSAVTEDKLRLRTRVEWIEGLGSHSPRVEPTAIGATVHVFRQRAALFGHNAPDPRLMDATTGSKLNHLVKGSGIDQTWKHFSIRGTQIDLDAAYPKIVPGSWFALVTDEPLIASGRLTRYTELYRAETVSFPSRRDYGLSGKVTRIEPDATENLGQFGLRETLVLAQSEELPVTATPLEHPLYGYTLELARPERDLAPGQALAVSGQRVRIRIRRGQPDVPLALEDGETVILSEGDSLRLDARPEMRVGAAWLLLSPTGLVGVLRNPPPRTLRLTLLDKDGRRGTLEVLPAMVELAPAEPKDEVVREITFIDALVTAVVHDRERSTLTLSAPLQHCYDRETAFVNANVAKATHGETVSEVLGSGDARVPNLRLSLRQSPLTCVSAATPSGRQSTLELRANDMLWSEVPSLYGSAATQRSYQIDIDEDTGTSVLFGDGVEGARPPSGDHNIRAVYRKGLGLAGNVGGGQLSTLLSRPLGVASAINPEAATGGEDPEAEGKARENAPLTVRTLDRAVSIRDYQDFSRAFAGIAKAHALWIASGPARGVFITVAGELGAEVPADSDTFVNLVDALHSYGDPLMPLRVSSYRDVRFALSLTVKVAADADASLVLPAVESALRLAFGFDARRFDQGVSVDEVVAVAHGVVGVEAVQVLQLQRVDTASPAFAPRLFAALPLASLNGEPLAAELLTLDDAPLNLEQMP
jgi:hypothetical protein